MFKRLIALTLLAGAASPAMAASEATATMMSPEGAELGTVVFVQTPHGVLIDADLSGIAPGAHGFHIHAVGACAPDFGAAGGHFAGGGAAHGLMTQDGPHAGDMPNIHVPASGALRIEVLNARVSLEGGPGFLFDADGSALLIHGGADDYAAQPSGAAGPRIACGVIEAAD